jgi:hypothetical protein
MFVEQEIENLILSKINKLKINQNQHQIKVKKSFVERAKNCKITL